MSRGFWSSPSSTILMGVVLLLAGAMDFVASNGSALTLGLLAVGLIAVIQGVRRRLALKRGSA